jgi:hypothetical protein
VCRHVLLEEVRAADNVIVEKENQVAPRRLNAFVPSGAGAAVRLFNDAQRTGGMKHAERLSGAVSRAVDNDDYLVFVRGEVLLENGWQSP